MMYLGKMLRIDVNQGNPYSIPESNPFSSSLSALNEIWALSLRNPWRFSFDRLTGDLWIGDVGLNATEEIDMQAAASTGGENYGWRCDKGNQPFNSDGCPAETSLTFPVYTYPHGEECSVAGGYVYRGSASSPYYGYYFFADYCSDRIWTLHNVSGTWIKEDFGQFAGNNFSTFGEDADGRLYVAGLTSGKIFRIDDGTTGTGEVDKLEGIKIINDPFSDNIRIETGRNDRTLILLELIDVKGAIRYSKELRESSFDIDINALRPGTYFLNIRIDGKKLAHKIVKGKLD
jgi:hypothetical protein